MEEFRQYCKYELEERLPFMYMINGFAGLIFIASILVLNVQQYNEQRRNFIILRQMGSGKRELAIGFFLNMCMFTLLMVMGAVMMARYGLVRWSQKYLDITLLVKVIVSLGDRKSVV